MKKYIVVMLFSFLMASCGQETEKIHLGENLRDKCHLVCMDSLKIVADSLSGNGNFYIRPEGGRRGRCSANRPCAYRCLQTQGDR